MGSWEVFKHGVSTTLMVDHRFPSQKILTFFLQLGLAFFTFWPPQQDVQAVVLVGSLSHHAHLGL